MTVVGPGINVVTDNWLLQNAAELVGKTTDPLSKANWVDVSADEITYPKTHLGTVQFQCLTSLLEQLTLAESLFVHGDWTTAWKGKLPALDALGDSVIRGIDVSDQVTVGVKHGYQELLCQHDVVREWYELASDAFKRDEPLPMGQVPAGTAIYLALADLKGCAYAPHPVRARFLSQTVHSLGSWPPGTTTRVIERLNEARVRLLRALRGEAAVTKIEYDMSSVALKCLADASTSVHPIVVAAQIRDDEGIRNLRACLHECAVAIGTDAGKAAALMAALNAAIGDVEKRLKLIPLGPADGPNELKVLSFPIRVPDFLRLPIIDRKHTTVLYGFVETGTRQVREIVSKALGIKDKAVLDALLPPAPTK